MLRKVAIALGILLLLAIGVIVYLWKQATALPDWYTAEAAPTAAPTAGDAAPKSAGWTPTADGKGQEVRNFHARSKKLKPGVRKAIKASRATYKDGNLEAGMVADLREVPAGELSSQESSFLQKARDAFPALADREVYIGIEGEPVIEDGVMKVGPKTRLRIGDLSYSLSDAAQKLGINQAQLEKELNAELARMGATK